MQHAELVPSLEALCERVAVSLIGPGDVCAALTLAEALSPAAGRLRAAGLRLLAERLPAVLAADAGGFAALPAAVLEALLQGQSLVHACVLLCYVFVCVSGHHSACMDTAMLTPGYFDKGLQTCKTVLLSTCRQASLANSSTQ